MCLFEGTVNEKHFLLITANGKLGARDRPNKNNSLPTFAMEVRLRDQPVRLFYLNHVYLKNTLFSPT